MGKKKRERQLIDGQWWTKPKRGKPRLLTRDAGFKTESEFWAMFKNALRGLTRFWRPKNEYLESRCRLYTGKNPRQKKEYQCENCLKWFSRANMEVDHIVPCGGINCFKDIGDVAERMFIEGQKGWRALCVSCHRSVTNENSK